MKTTYAHIDSGCLLFKQWSHKSYAVFNSLGKVVHIGFILPIVNELVTTKGLVGCQFFRILGFDLKGALHESEQLLVLMEFEGLLDSAELFNQIVRLQSAFPGSSASFKSFTYYFINHIRPNYGLFYFQNIFGIKMADISFCSVQLAKS